jgi:hypothetical protein
MPPRKTEKVFQRLASYKLRHNMVSQSITLQLFSLAYDVEGTVIDKNLNSHAMLLCIETYLQVTSPEHFSAACIR